MKKGIWILVLVYMGLAGCVPGHFTNNNGDFIKLYLRAPSANAVQFVSNLDRYQIHDIETNSQGLWEVRVPSHSEFKYFYIVDGLVFLPNCQFKENDDFGRQNCIYQP